MPQETSNLLLGTRFWHLEEGFYLFRVHLFSFLTYDETQQFSRLDPEGALRGVQPQLILPKPFEQPLQVDEVFLLSFRLRDLVVYVEFNLSVHHVVEQGHHSPLIGCPSILEPKGHHLIGECSPEGDERGLFHILWCHLYLIVA